MTDSKELVYLIKLKAVIYQYIHSGVGFQSFWMFCSFILAIPFVGYICGVESEATPLFLGAKYYCQNMLEFKVFGLPYATDWYFSTWITFLITIYVLGTLTYVLVGFIESLFREKISSETAEEMKTISWAELGFKFFLFSLVWIVGAFILFSLFSLST